LTKFINMKACLLILLLICISFHSNAQLQAGFNKEEYIELMKINAHTVYPFKKNKVDTPLNATRIFSESNFGLDNAWELWVNDKNAAIISIRGSTQKIESWLLNFYAAMVPAQGKIAMQQDKIFQYEFTKDTKAQVHVGWLMALAWMDNSIRHQLDSLAQHNIYDIYITGHSQGGAIANLLTAHLLSLQQQGKISAKFNFKTYASAAPKTGNLYYAYAYARLCKKGMEFNVINTLDWVPEMPFSIQSFKDFNDINPFKNAKKTINKLPFPQNMAIHYVYGKLNRPTKRAHKNYNKLLGQRVYRMVHKYNDDFANPTNKYSTNYSNIGTHILLFPDKEYLAQFQYDGKNVFIHHSHSAYIYLVQHNQIDD
jgi:hypothetical protein